MDEWTDGQMMSNGIVVDRLPTAEATNKKGPSAELSTDLT